MNLRQIRYFLTIADSGSFSKAAEILHIAQPSLSQHVRNLEDDLGVELLYRHPRGATPTEAGLLLCKHVRAVLRDMEHAKEIVRSSTQDPMGEVSVGLSTAACRELAVPIVQRAAQRYPRISIHLMEAMSGNLDEWIQSGRLDIALLYEHKAFEDIRTTDLMTEDLVLVQSPRHARSRESITLAEVLAMPLVLPSQPHILRNVMEQFSARAGQRLNVAVNCDSLPGIVQLVRNGYASIFSAFGVKQEEQRGELHCTPITDPTPSWRLSIVLSQKIVNMRAAAAIANIMRDTICQLVDVGEWQAKLNPSIRKLDHNSPVENPSG